MHGLYGWMNICVPLKIIDKGSVHCYNILVSNKLCFNRVNEESGETDGQGGFSLLVENSSGVLSRVAGLFTRRGYNIDSIAAGMTADPKFTRITVVARGDEIILEQIENS